MSDKYPSLTPYNYCAGNPMILVDPNGEEVEFNSFTDRVIVAFAKLFNSDFRAKFKELKKSKETYVFNHNKNGNNSFSTDGNKLFINYDINDNQKADGQSIFSMLRHETTHGVQFEHGELGFENKNAKWSAINYDIMDEMEAHTSQNLGIQWNVKHGSSRDLWNSQFEENKKSSGSGTANQIQALQSTSAYSKLPLGPINTSNSAKIENATQFMLPNRPRNK
jgi:hypothetical protein